MQSRNVTCIPVVVYNLKMVDPNMPWSLKGISEEARKFAKQSADNLEMPTGAWLSAVIRAAAFQETGLTEPANTGTRNESASPPLVSPPEPIRQAGSTIERAAQFVDDFGFEPEGPARDADLIDDTGLLQSELDALERRLQVSEANTGETLDPLAREIDRIRARLNALKDD